MVIDYYIGNPKMKKFEYIKVCSIGEALDLLRKYGASGQLLAGGSDLLLQIKQHAVEPAYLIDIKGIPNLGSIKQEGDTLSIGTLVTLRDIEKSEIIKTKFPALTNGVCKIASVQLRNIATLGGNLCQAIKCPYYNQSHINMFMRRAIKPCFRKGGNVCHVVTWGEDVGNIVVGNSYCRVPLASDMAIVLATLGGAVELVGRKGSSREINVENLYKKDSKLNIARGEILTHVKIPMSSNAAVFLMYKSNPSAYTSVSVAVSLALDKDKETCESARIYLGGVAPQPYKAKDVEQYIRGKKLNDQVNRKAVELLFEDTKAANNAIVFKIAKARDLCREALTKVWENAKE